MDFAHNYFQRVKTFDKFIDKKPTEKTAIIAVIPVYNEPDIVHTLKSLYNNNFNSSLFTVEIIFVINSAINTDLKIKATNRETAKFIRYFAEENNHPGIKTYLIEKTDLPDKMHGAGLARKIGMDEALRRFDFISKPEGIILSLDADTLVEENYFRVVYEYYRKHKKICGANINFEHPIEGNYANEIYKAITIYEIYLRYYIEALRFTGYPYAYHTIGSAFSVKADTYAKVGGMVVNQSGEDFYFIQKLIQSCQYGEIKLTTVYPSPRITDRVIFGTGVAVREIIEKYKFIYPTYTQEAFIDIRKFIESQEVLREGVSYMDLKINRVLKEFLKILNAEDKIKEIIKNTANKDTFKKRFFHWFNALRILRYLNYSHENYYTKNDVCEEASKLIQILTGKKISKATEILTFLRQRQNK